MNNIQALAELQERRKGIATTHNGVRYRSRLEAKWAEFFRLLGWRAFYEPFDLDGYIPDFILHGHKQQILVEVKPVSGMDDPLFKETTAKIEQSGWQHEALIVSYFLPEADDELCVGWLAEYYSATVFADENCGGGFGWDFAPFDNGGGRVGFNHLSGGYCNRITGHSDGGHRGICTDTSTVHWKSLIEIWWRDAGNAVQWRAP